MKLVNKENMNSYEVVSTSYGSEVDFKHPEANRALKANIGIDAGGNAYAWYYCPVKGKVTAKFDIIDPLPKVAEYIEKERYQMEKRKQEKEQERWDFINQEEAK